MNVLKHSVFLFVILSFFLSISGCDGLSKGPTLDGSNEDAFKASVKKVADALPESEKKEFAAAMIYLTFNQVEFKDVMKNADTAAAKAQSGLYAAVDGKTGQEVIDMVRDMKKQKLQSKISELKQDIAKQESAKQILTKFTVKNAKYYKRKSSFMEEPIISMTVTNGTDKAIARAFFVGTLASPGRSIPWLQEDFNHSISGGLEPGETQKWSLAPNPFSKWGTVKPNKDAVLNVEVVELRGNSDKVLWSARKLDEEKKQLKKAQSDLATLH